MENIKWVFMDGYDKVIEVDSQKLVFETNTIADKTVVDNVVSLNNKNKTDREIDSYLLDEGLCTTEEREFIVEKIYAYRHN